MKPLTLTFLGTGGAFCDYRQNYHNNAMVTLPTGERLLIDCGGTAPQSLKELGVAAWEIQHVLLTHMHGDHVGGLEQMGWENFYLAPNKWGHVSVIAPLPVISKAKDHLTPCVDLYTAPGPGGALVAQSGGVHRLFRWTAVRPGINLPVALPCRFVPVDHIPGTDYPAFGLMLGDRTLYSSDTVYRESWIIQMAGVVDLIFHECTFTPWYAGTVHTHFEELCKLPEWVRAKIVLMHHTAVPSTVDVTSFGFRVANRHSEWVLP